MGKEFLAQDPWRVLRIMAEFVDGFEMMSQVPPGISVFGSARSKPGQVYYEKAVQAGRCIAEAGFSAVTGGGPGVIWTCPSAGACRPPRARTGPCR